VLETLLLTYMDNQHLVEVAKTMGKQALSNRACFLLFWRKKRVLLPYTAPRQVRAHTNLVRVGGVGGMGVTPVLLFVGITGCGNGFTLAGTSESD